MQMVSNMLKEHKAGRSSLTSFNSAVSILQNGKTDSRESGDKRMQKESILKSQKDSVYNKSQYRRKEVATEGNEEAEREHSVNFVTQNTERKHTDKDGKGKGYLKNSYSLIKEDVDKENTMTPALGTESPGIALHGRKEKRSSFEHHF